jgi:hypothetical protein
MKWYYIFGFLFLFGCDKNSDQDIIEPEIILSGILNEKMNLQKLDLIIEPAEVGCLTYKITDSVDIDLNDSYDLLIHLLYVKPDSTGRICCDCPLNDPLCECFPNTGTRLRYMSNLNSEYEILIDENRAVHNRGLIKKCSYGDTINKSKYWLNDKELVFYYTSFHPNDEYGNWALANDGYIGIRRINDVDTCYGWISIELTDTCRIVEVALQQK